MLVNAKPFIFCVLATFSSSMSWASSSCLLNYNLPAHPISQMIRKKVIAKSDVTYVENANPMDFYDCIRDGHETVTLVLHSFDEGDSKQLAYIRTSFGRDGKEHDSLQPFLPRLFQKVDQLLTEQERNGSRHLKRIRFMVCDSDEVIERYGSLKKLVTAHDIELEFAPRSKLLSALMGQPVVRFSSKWLRRGL